VKDFRVELYLRPSLKITWRGTLGRSTEEEDRLAGADVDDSLELYRGTPGPEGEFRGYLRNKISGFIHVHIDDEASFKMLEDRLAVARRLRPIVQANEEPETGHKK
jgi:hypothetical protein